jgi:hypothetical protein
MDQRPTLSAIVMACFVSCAGGPTSHSVRSQKDATRPASPSEGRGSEQSSDGAVAPAPTWTVASWFNTFRKQVSQDVKCPASQNVHVGTEPVRFRVVVAAGGDLMDLRRESASSDPGHDEAWETAIRAAAPFRVVPEAVLKGEHEVAFWFEIVPPCTAPPIIRWQRARAP